ncbi:hypothetical protein, partial [Escherichia coli]|uniref:hypothetical protein n=1 Tax=Escherichia coli TaxID=562 RepID=UPI0019535B73
AVPSSIALAMGSVPKGNYSMEILNVSIAESNGAQYDRPVYIFANGVPIFWGSTQEFFNSLE